VLIIGALIFRITEKMLRKKALLGQYWLTPTLQFLFLYHLHKH
jgi:hypothetical protein